MFYNNRMTREYSSQREFGRDFFRPMTNRFWANEMTNVMPQTNILELDEQFILEVALPGVVLDDVELKIEENVLTLIAKRTPNMIEERAHLVQQELPVGYFVRHFELATDILVDHIEARLDRGILFISLPKVEQAVRIPVSHGSLESHLPGLKTRVGKTELRNKELTVK